MRQLMAAFRAYPTLVRAYFALAVEYRAQGVVWVLTSLLPIVMMMVWITVAEQQPGGEIAGFDRLGFISYFLGILVVRRLSGVWIIWQLDEDIRLGTLSANLLRPLNPVHVYFTRGVLGKYLVELTIVLPPVAIASYILNAQYDLRPANMLLVIVAMLGASLVEFFIQMSIGGLAFWFTQMLSFVQIWFFARSLFNGWVIPLVMFPQAVQDIVVYLPFRYTLSFPTEILLGSLTINEVVFGFGVQLSWIFILFGCYKLVWRLGLKHFTAVGA